MSSVNYKYSVWMVTSSNTESNSIISNMLQLDKTYSITEIKLQLKTVISMIRQKKYVQLCSHKYLNYSEIVAAVTIW